MARYLFLLHTDGANLGELPQSEKEALFNRFVVWSESLKSRGHLRGVESLMDSGGQTVRKKRDNVVVDGPYAEMKEMVTGLFVIEAPDPDAAHRLAAECPLLGIGGCVEVREIAPFPVRAANDGA
jgi:hypothetical protein